MSQAQVDPAINAWAPKLEAITEKQQSTLNDIYRHMLAGNFTLAETELAKLYKEVPQVLPQWLALLTEQQQYEKIRKLVDEGIVSPTHSSAVIANTLASGSLPQLYFEQSQASIPLQGHWLVPLPRVKLRLNEHEFYFVLDTGASQSLVTDKVVKQLQLDIASQQQVEIDTATANTVKADLVRLPPFQLGPVKAQDQLALVVDHTELEQRFLGINWYQLDGIIGWPIIKALDLTLDFEEQIAEIKKPALQQEKSGNLVWLFDDPMVITKANNTNQLWFLDTGAMESQITRDYLSPEQYHSITWKERKFNGLGGKGAVEKTAKFGPISIHFPSITQHFKKLTVRADHQDCSHSRCDGRLGVDTADSLRMHINFHAASFDIRHKH
ncbi:clan AA aspartic protease [Pseudoalteromonas sp. McH1-7]|uniref:retropepsin-like aspartic protease n=1 Tax=Pseudoalteromonas sp. McH1-7 TaxID=2745574 RepID=UPI0015919E2F|nr:retropepsin-like aspartic protease [Pseudoalteromonas sp. McH1-7]NUZ09901.1 clan AA aspartic protease [Pseudoalteromonas sp. McH1-7]